MQVKNTSDNHKADQVNKDEVLVTAQALQALKIKDILHIKEE